MLFRRLRDEQAVLPLMRFLLKQLGICNGSGRLRYLVFFLGFCFTVALPKLIFSYPDIPTGICGIAELFFISNVVCGGLLLWLRTDDFEQLMQQLQSLAEHLYQDSMLRTAKQYLIEFNRRVHRYMNVYLFLVAYLIVFFMIAPIVNSLWLYFVSMAEQHSPQNATHANNSLAVVGAVLKPSEFSLHMEQGFYGLRPRTNVVHYGIFTLFVLPVMVMTAFTVHTKVLVTFGCTRYGEAFLYLLTKKLDNLRLLPEEAVAREIRDIVHVHQRILHCIKLLVIVLQPILLMQLTFCIFIWCSMMLYFFVVDELTLKFVNLAILFMVITIETSGTCYFGTRLSTQATELAKAVYACGWEDMNDDGLRKRLRLVLLRAQKPVGLMAGKFCFVDMERFQKMVNASYSVFIVLKDAF